MTYLTVIGRTNYKIQTPIELIKLMSKPQFKKLQLRKKNHENNTKIISIIIFFKWFYWDCIYES